MYRHVKHMGARSLSAAGSGVGVEAQLLWAMPTFRGDSLKWLECEFFGCETGDEPPEQPNLIGMFVGWVPGIILSGQSITLATVEDDVRTRLFGGSMANKHWGGEPNDAADEGDWLPSDQVLTGARMMWERVQVTVPEVFGSLAVSGTTSGIESKHSFRRRMRLKSGRFATNGIIVGGVYQPSVTAQTTLGVTELDDQIDISELHEAVEGGNTTADSDAAKVKELIFGGDNYIEADTLKDFEGRVYSRVQAGIWSPNLRKLRR